MSKQTTYYWTDPVKDKFNWSCKKVQRSNDKVVETKKFNDKQEAIDFLELKVITITLKK